MRSKVKISVLIKYIVLCSVALIMLYPLFWVFLSSLKENNEIFSRPFSFPLNPKWDNYSTAWEAADVNKVEGRRDPSVALTNNGAEESKGTPMLKEAHQLLKTTPGIRFVGNIEPRDVPNGKVDVVVCDGFTGNVILKLTEGVAKMLLGMLKQMFLANFGGKIAYLLLKGGVSDLKHQMDSEEYGGAPFLGAKQPVIKAHGSSKAKGIKNAIRQAKTCVENDLCGTMQSALDELAAANKPEE